jgi:hypothetical protein
MGSSTVAHYDLVRADIRPTQSQRRGPKRHSRFTRRDFIRLIGTVATGAGLSFVGLFPVIRPAWATDLTPSTTWNGTYAGSPCCDACASVKSSYYCGSDGWHRHHNTSSQLFALRTSSCGTVANSWINFYNGSNWRCSDGKYKNCGSSGCTSWQDSVCPKKQ